MQELTDGNPSRATGDLIKQLERPFPPDADSVYLYGTNFEVDLHSPSSSFSQGYVPSQLQSGKIHEQSFLHQMKYSEKRKVKWGVRGSLLRINVSAN